MHRRIYSLILIIFSFFGLMSSFRLIMDKFNILSNPDFVPICSINEVYNCKTVISSVQAEAFGFPNPILGLIGFSVLITVGIALLSGVKFNKWFMSLMNSFIVLGLAFCHWLIYHTVFTIEAVCLWCSLVWLSVISIFIFSMKYYVIEYKAFSSLRKIFESKIYLYIYLIWLLAIVVLIKQQLG